MYFYDQIPGRVAHKYSVVVLTMALFFPMIFIGMWDVSGVETLATVRSALRFVAHHTSYSQHPNLALASDGAAILPSYNAVGSMRSPPHVEPGDDSTLGGDSLDCQGPGNPLHPSTDPHRMWCFMGSQGQLGVLLSVPGRITNISISHPSLLSLLPSAPRNIILWGVVDGEANKSIYDNSGNILQLLRTQLPVQSPFARYDHRELMYVPLASFSFNIKEVNMHQVFNVFPEINGLRMDFGIVVVQVVNNWGGAHTGLYHVGVYGEKVVGV